MKNNWVDFKQLRSRLDFEQMLTRYGVKVNRRGDQHYGFCPLPHHNGKKNSPSFSANLRRGMFQCFGCGKKGNVLEFAALMEGIDPNDRSALHKFALSLQIMGAGHQRSDNQNRAVNEPDCSNSDSRIRIVNAPLDFELKGLDPAHPYLFGRGFNSDTLAHFGVGYCSRGLLKGRIAIPLHDQIGQLIGYAGRLIDDALCTEENPRYRFPGERERDGKKFAFRKRLFLYNAFRIKAPVNDLIVVEGFTSVWWLAQNGFPSVVATMGAECSGEQAKLLVSMVKLNGRVWVVSDGDSAGFRHAQKLLCLLAPHRFVKWLQMETEKQASDLAPNKLKLLFDY